MSAHRVQLPRTSLLLTLLCCCTTKVAAEEQTVNCGGTGLGTAPAIAWRSTRQEASLVRPAVAEVVPRLLGHD